MQTFYLISLEMQHRTLANYFFIILLSVSPGNLHKLAGSLKLIPIGQLSSPCDSHKNVNSKFESSPLLVVRI